MSFRLTQTIFWDGKTLQVELDRYQTPPNLGLIIFDGHAAYAIATVNPDQQILEEGLVAIKTWDNQEDLVGVLAAAGIIDAQQVSEIQCGFCTATVHRLLVDWSLLPPPALICPYCHGTGWMPLGATTNAAPCQLPSSIILKETFCVCEAGRDLAGRRGASSPSGTPDDG